MKKMRQNFNKNLSDIKPRWLSVLNNASLTRTPASSGGWRCVLSV
jgi:hypothetical protein